MGRWLGIALTLSTLTGCIYDVGLTPDDAEPFDAAGLAPDDAEPLDATAISVDAAAPDATPAPARDATPPALPPPDAAPSALPAPTGDDLRRFLSAPAPLVPCAAAPDLDAEIGAPPPLPPAPDRMRCVDASVAPPPLPLPAATCAAETPPPAPPPLPDFDLGDPALSEAATDADGRSLRLAWDRRPPWGAPDERALLLVDAQGQPQGTVVRTLDDDGRVVTTVYDAQRRPIGLDLDGVATTWFYDVAGHLAGASRTTSGASARWILQFDACGRLVERSHAEAAAFERCRFDMQDRLVDDLHRSGSADERHRRWLFDAQGRTVRSEVLDGDRPQRAVFAYDADGRLAQARSCDRLAPDAPCGFGPLDGVADRWRYGYEADVLAWADLDAGDDGTWQVRVCESAACACD